MHREVVERRRWISERRFLHALNYCMVLPGPEAQQLATYIGWLTNGVRGAVGAGSLFILPGFFVMLLLSIVYAQFGDVRWVSGLLFGLQAAVVVLVVQALVRISRRTINAPAQIAIAASAFIALFFFAVPFPIVIVAAGLVGWLLGRTRGTWLPEPDDSSDDAGSPTLVADDEAVPARGRRNALIAAAVCLVAWLAPVLVLLLVLGQENIFTQEAVLFSKVAVVTFGGAYAGLAYVSQVAVQQYGWLSTADMTTGLGLAETTPGPLVLVMQFVGFLAAYNHPGSLPPLVAGILGAIVTVWVIFVPCFMFIFAGAPYVERLRHSRVVHYALVGIGAAVVGVIANLALWFALSTFFQVDTYTAGPLRVSVPDLSTVNVEAVVIAGVAALLVFRFRLPTLVILGICALMGMTAAFIG